MFCLLRPPAVESFRVATMSVTMPLGIAYICAALERKAFEVQVLDAVGEAPKQKVPYYKGYLIGLRLEEIVKKISPNVSIIGISVIFTHEWPAVVRLIDLIKEAHPEIPIVVGGEHCTSMPEFCLASSKADIVALGEGEETVIELARWAQNLQPLSSIKGIAYHRHSDDCIVVNERRLRNQDVDDISYPAWDHIKVTEYNSNQYVGGMDVGSMTIPILATRGCPYQCTYCSSPNMWLPRWIPRDPVKVVDEIEFLYEKYGARNFPLQDLTAIIRKDWIVTFCEEIIRRKLAITWQFPSGTRCEAVDDKIANLMRDTGMVSIAYAPETGSSHTRKLIKKKMKDDDLLKSITSAIAAGLNVAVLLVIGFPHETKEDVKENIAFVRKLRKMGITDLIINYYTALPGTELFNSLYDSGKISFDRQYFSHILHGSEIFPAISHSEYFTRLSLFYWKFRIFFSFYRTRSSSKRFGKTGSISRALSGLSESAHASRLQTAFRVAVRGALAELAVKLKKPWVSNQEEGKIFQSWDLIYKNICDQNLSLGVRKITPEDTADLHLENVIESLRTEHSTARELAIH